MPKVTVNFADVKEFEVLDKGDYDGVIAKAEYRDFPDEPDRYPYINLEFDLQHDGDTRKAWSILSLSPKALWRMKQTFEELGLPVDEVEIEVDDETNLVTSPELVGIPVTVSISKRVYEGREQNQVDAIKAQDGSKGKKTSAGAKRRSFK